MTRFSDAALLKGEYAAMLKEPPKEAEWNKASCDNGAEEAAQSIAKQIFAMRQAINPESERLEVIAFSALGPFKVLQILPVGMDMMRMDGIRPELQQPVSVLQHVSQLSLTFTKATMTDPEHETDEGMQIGFVIFDELKERKKQRAASKRKKAPAKRASKKDVS